MTISTTIQEPQLQEIYENHNYGNGDHGHVLTTLSSAHVTI